MKSDITFHILNGDALRERFPKTLKGEVIVMRECLVEGPVDGEDLSSFLKVRARFISKSYNSSEDEYDQKVASEFRKIQNIPDGSTVNLWFEDDLFCQANFWWVGHLLYTSGKSIKPFIVRPQKLTSFGFGGLNDSELTKIHENKRLIADLQPIDSLWLAYRGDERNKLKEVAVQLESDLPFILPAVEAHLDRRRPDKLGRPERSLVKIMHELRSREFGPVFREFCRRESIYGFGDSQVRRLFDSLVGT